MKQAAFLESRGMNPADVGGESKLSSGKAEESWRDAGVLFGNASQPVDLTQQDGDSSGPGEVSP